MKSLEISMANSTQTDESIELPDNIKKEIQKNVTELKELLKDNQDVAEELISMVCNIGNLYVITNVYDFIFNYYSKEIEVSNKYYKGLPENFLKLKQIAYKLSTLVDGTAFEIVALSEAYNENNFSQVCNEFGDLSKKEIGHQFSEGANYIIDVEPMLMGEMQLPSDEGEF